MIARAGNIMQLRAFLVKKYSFKKWYIIYIVIIEMNVLK